VKIGSKSPVQQFAAAAAVLPAALAELPVALPAAWSEVEQAGGSVSPEQQA